MTTYQQVLQVVEGYWPSGPWTEDVERVWLFDFNSYDVRDLVEGAKRLHRTHESTFAPPWPTFAAAVELACADRLRAEQRKALPGPDRETHNARGVPYVPMPEWFKRKHKVGSFRELRVGYRVGDAGGHHHGPGIDGHKVCPICSKHDHDDKRTFGFTRRKVKSDPMRLRPGQESHEVELSQDVPAWWFTCPQCGDPETAQFSCDSWTTEGIAFMRQWRGRVTEPTTDDGVF